MKKKMAAVVTAAAMLALSVPVAQAYGAPSPVEDDVYNELMKNVKNINMENVQAWNDQNEAISIKVSPVEDEEQIFNEEKARLKITEGMNSNLLEDIRPEGGSVNAEVLGFINVTSSETLTSSVRIRIPVDGVHAGDHVALMQYIDGQWEPVVPSEVGEGYIVAEVSSLTPMSVVKYSAVSGNQDVEPIDTETESENTESKNTESANTEFEDTGFDDTEDTEFDDSEEDEDPDEDENSKKGGNGGGSLDKNKSSNGQNNNGTGLNTRTAVKLPLRGKTVVAPKTSDSVLFYAFGGLAAVSAAGIGVVAYKLKKNGKRRT